MPAFFLSVHVVVSIIGACGQGLCPRVIPYDLCQYQVYIKHSIHYLSHQAIINGEHTRVYVYLSTQCKLKHILSR